MITSSDIQAARQARLRELRKAKFGSVKEAADHFRLSVNTLSSHESGRRKIDERAALKYASAFKVDPAYLLALDLSNDSKELSTTIPSAVSVKSIPVYGRSAGGVWLEGEVVLENSEADLWIPASNKAEADKQYARLVVGNSVSNKVPDGSFAIFVRRDAFPGPIPYGALVDVHRIRAGLHEYSIKAYWGDRLSTDSRELDVQHDLELASSDEDAIVVIEGVAVGFYGNLL